VLAHDLPQGRGVRDAVSPRPDRPTVSAACLSQRPVRSSQDPPHLHLPIAGHRLTVGRRPWPAALPARRASLPAQPPGRLWRRRGSDGDDDRGRLWPEIPQDPPLPRSSTGAGHRDPRLTIRCWGTRRRAHSGPCLEQDRRAGRPQKWPPDPLRAIMAAPWTHTPLRNW
jgi:hypothetical protein